MSRTRHGTKAVELVEESGELRSPRLLAHEERAARARTLSDDQLLHYQQLLHDGGVEDALWLPVLDAEVVNRGLASQSKRLKRR